MLKTLFNTKYCCYDSCSELPLYNFIKIITTKDLRWLIKDGEPDNLEETWELIYSEYVELSGDKSNSYILDLIREISVLENRLIQIQSIVNYLATVRRCEELILLLQTGYGFRLKYDDLSIDLPRTINQAKSDLLKLQKKQAEYAKLGEDQTESTEQDYIKNLQALSKHQGYQVRSKDISVAEYIALINDFNKSQENGRK